jgi:hydroxymethylpyrimidine pyrophosphatase-like HAD family hydrolase
VIVATWVPHDEAVLQAIRELGLALQISYNKGAEMVLPSGVHKGTGLAACLQELELSPLDCVGVGDAENDHPFLSLCGLSVAVANALPAVKETVGFVTESARGAGVVELVAKMLGDDLRAPSRGSLRAHATRG